MYTVSFGFKAWLLRGLPVVMAAGIGLRETKLSSEESFKALWDSATDYILFECLDDAGNAQGLAVGAVTSRYHADGDGAFIKLDYVAASDEYYAHWIVDEGGSAKWHHVCRRSWSSCRRKVGRDQIVHIQKMAWITLEDVEACLRQWKVKRLDRSLPGGRRKPVTPVDDAKAPKEADLQTASKAKAAKPPRGEERRGDGRGDSEDSRGGSAELSGAEDDDVGRSNASKPRSGRKHSRRRRSHRDSRSPRRCRPEEARGSVGDLTRGHRKKKSDKSSPLDAILEDDGAGPFEADSRLEVLRRSLEEKKQKKPEAKEGASAVLARRVQAGVEGSKKRRKESEQDKVKRALKTLSKTKEEASSSSLDDSDDDAAVFGVGRGDSDLLSRQRKLRKLSSEKPGALLVKGFSLMHEQLGTLYGDPATSTSSEAVLQPGALRYLLTTALPLVDVKKVGEEKVRELRTLASTLDLVVSGRVGMAGDMLMQRFKSLLMALKDGSSAASRYLELVPMELYPTAATLEESDFARSLAVKNAKSEALLSRVRSTG